MRRRSRSSSNTLARNTGGGCRWGKPCQRQRGTWWSGWSRQWLEWWSGWSGRWLEWGGGWSGWWSEWLIWMIAKVINDDEGHLSRFAKLGLSSTSFLLNAHTHRIFPETIYSWKYWSIKGWTYCWDWEILTHFDHSNLHYTSFPGLLSHYHFFPRGFQLTPSSCWKNQTDRTSEGPLRNLFL